MLKTDKNGNIIITKDFAIIIAMILFGALLGGLAIYGLVEEGQAALAILNNKKVNFFLLISGNAIAIWQIYRFKSLCKKCFKLNKSDEN